MTWATPLVGRTDMDCWALVRAVYLEQCGVELPTYGDIDHRELAAVAATLDHDAHREPWFSVAPFPGAEKTFDVVIMTGWLRTLDGVKRRGVVHAGIVSRPGYVLHTDMGYAAVEVPLSHATVRGKLVACYRHAVHGGALGAAD